MYVCIYVCNYVVHDSTVAFNITFTIVNVYARTALAKSKLEHLWVMYPLTCLLNALLTYLQ